MGSKHVWGDNSADLIFSSDFILWYPSTVALFAFSHDFNETSKWK